MVAELGGRPPGFGPGIESHAEGLGALSRSTRAPRVALYSQGMVGFGHIRRNASIAQALRSSALQPTVLMIAEAWQAGALLVPDGVDFVTLPALRRGADGGYSPRFLSEVSDRELITLRTRVIRDAIEVFEPDVLIVDYLPLGVAEELRPTLHDLHDRGGSRCVLGLRDVLYDLETVNRWWATSANLNAIKRFYDAIWIYGDPAVFDPVREYDFTGPMAAKTHHTGYLDQRPRLEYANAEVAPLLADLPPGRTVLCLVGGGHDGRALAETFLESTLPQDATGVLVTGPLMPWDVRRQIRHEAEGKEQFRVLDFVHDPTPLIDRADRIIAMGGYNTVCEALSFEKHALIVPRVNPEPEQWIRAQHLRDMGLIDVLHPDELSATALSTWLARDLGPPPASRKAIDFNGLARVPVLLAELLASSSEVTLSS